MQQEGSNCTCTFTKREMGSKLSTVASLNEERCYVEGLRLVCVSHSATSLRSDQGIPGAKELFGLIIYPGENMIDLFNDFVSYQMR